MYSLGDTIAPVLPRDDLQRQSGTCAEHVHRGTWVTCAKYELANMIKYWQLHRTPLAIVCPILTQLMQHRGQRSSFRITDPYNLANNGK